MAAGIGRGGNVLSLEEDTWDDVIGTCIVVLAEYLVGFSFSASSLAYSCRYQYERRVFHRQGVRQRNGRSKSRRVCLKTCICFCITS